MPTHVCYARLGGDMHTTLGPGRGSLAAKLCGAELLGGQHRSQQSGFGSGCSGSMHCTPPRRMAGSAAEGSAELMSPFSTRVMGPRLSPAAAFLVQCELVHGGARCHGPRGPGCGTHSRPRPRHPLVPRASTCQHVRAGRPMHYCFVSVKCAGEANWPNHLPAKPEGAERGGRSRVGRSVTAVL